MRLLYTQCQAAGIAYRTTNQMAFLEERACERKGRMVLMPAECPGASIRHFLSLRSVGSISRLFLSIIVWTRKQTAENEFIYSSGTDTHSALALSHQWISLSVCQLLDV